MNEEFMSIDTSALESLKYYMPEEDTLRQLRDIFFLFADVTRLKILSALSITEMCVSDLSSVLCINQTTISHQLKFLKGEGLVSDKRVGKSIIYSLSSPLSCSLLATVVDYVC